MHKLGDEIANSINRQQHTNNFIVSNHVNHSVKLFSIVGTLADSGIILPLAVIW
jgi:Mg2+ and Co2+ transporter CorA